MNQTATLTVTLVIFGPLTITPPTLPAGTVGQAYPATQLQAVGGVAPYNWSATGMPTGLVLSTSGLISGTPTANGTFSAVITCKDSGQ